MNGSHEQAAPEDAWRDGYAAGRTEARVDTLEKNVGKLVGKIDELIPVVADLKARAAVWGGVGALVIAPLIAWLVTKF